MRLLWLSHFLPYPPKGGALQRSYHLLRYAAARHDVHLVSLYRDQTRTPAPLHEEAMAHLGRMVRSLATFPIASDASRLKWWALAARTGLQSTPYDVAWLRNHEMALWLQALDPRQYDLLHVDTVGLWPYAEILKDLPIALHHHNVESHLTGRRAEREPRLLHRLYFRGEARKLRELEAAACPKAAVNLVVSDLDGTRLRQVAPPARVAVVENGVDIEYFKPAPLATPIPGRLVFAGGMNWYPNRAAVIHFVSQIWPRLVAIDPNYSATVIGQDPPAELVDHPDPRLQATGFVDDVRPLIDAAEIYVCPIRDGGGTRLKVLDALAMAKPLVATKLAVEGLSMTPGLHYLPADSPSEFVLQIERLRREPELRRRLGAAGRSLVQGRYSWSAVGAALDLGYTAALERDSTSRPLDHSGHTGANAPVP